MADYRRMYLTLMDAVENAVEILIAAQQKCEDIYVSQLMVFPKPKMILIRKTIKRIDLFEASLA